MWTKIFILAFVTLLGNCHDVKVKVEEQHSVTGENEFISVDLKKKDGSEDIKITALLKFHLINGHVHLNGNELTHGVVNFVDLRVTIVEIEKGIKKDPRLAPVQLRVLVAEETLQNGNKLLMVEEEFVTVEEFEVIQVEVQQLIWEGSVRKSITTKPLEKSKVHSKPIKDDQPITFADEEYGPHHPGKGLVNDEYDHHHRHHHCHHHGKHNHSRHHGHGHHGKIKCWYRHLSWKSKLGLFSVGFLSVIAMVLCCAICAKKRRGRRTLEVTAPIDDSVAVNMDDVKKSEGKEEKKYDFHFEFDNSVVVDDKKTLIE